jgi:hypothetical protein
MATLGRIKPRNFDTTGDYVANSLTTAGNVSAGNIRTNNILTANGTPYNIVQGAAGSNTQLQFNDANSFAGSANLTFDKTTNTLSVTNITTTGTANLGSVSNVKITGGSNAQLISTDGNGNLSFVNQVSLTGYATETYVGNAIANLVNSAPAVLDTLGEISNALGNDASFSTSITNSLANKLNTNAFSNTANDWAANYLPNYSGNLSANAFTTTGNVTANFFIGNGSQLTGLPASYSDTNVAAYLPNYTGNVSANFFIGNGSQLTGITATSAQTVTTNAQPNITSVGTLTSLSVTGNVSFTGANVSLGNVSNLKITGGSANQVLKTDGSGNLSWAAQETPVASVSLDSFTGDGSQTAFTLTTTPAGENQLVVNVDGVLQLKTAYSLTGNVITFTSAPDNGVPIEVQAFAFSGAAASINLWSYTGNGVQTVFNVSSTATANSLIVTENGILQMPITDYTVSNSAVNFAGAPANNISIQIRELPSLLSATSVSAQTVTTNAQPNITSVGNLTSLTMAGNIIPATTNTYSLGNTTNRFKDLYLEGNTIYLGNTALSSEDVLPFNLTIQPEVLTINTDGSGPGNDIMWLWTWTQSSLPYARTSITNQQQIQVPLYKQGTYQVNNFANEIHGNLDQRHGLYLKWVDGAGLDNLVSWANNVGNVTHSHPNINGGANTTVQRLNISVPSTVTPPTLTIPTGVSYNVAANGSGAYSISGSGVGENRNIGPLYRGATYTFNLDSSLASHPFYITTDNGTGFVSGQYVGEYTTGVTGSRGNGQSGYETLTFTVANNAPDTLYYQCGNHAPMRGAITIKNLAVETNVNGNYVLYFQHMKEGHKTPVEIRPIPSMVNQMCLVYDATAGQFVPQDMATYIENTPSFKNKIQEVAGTATLIAPSGVAVVPTVLVVEDVSYLPLVDNSNGDLAFDAYTNTLYVWETNAWRNTKPTSSFSVAGNITATNFIGNGSQLTGISAGVSEARVVGYNLVFGG